MVATLRERGLGGSVPVRCTVSALQLVDWVLRGSDVHTVFRRFLQIFLAAGWCGKCWKPKCLLLTGI